jgi:hypothetical protein
VLGIYDPQQGGVTEVCTAHIEDKVAKGGILPVAHFDVNERNDGLPSFGHVLNKQIRHLISRQTAEQVGRFCSVAGCFLDEVTVGDSAEINRIIVEVASETF